MSSAVILIFLAALGAGVLAGRAMFRRPVVPEGFSPADDMVRHGTKSEGVVVGMRPTGADPAEYREVELDVMVRTAEGGQFPARHTALVPAAALADLAPGAVVDIYYRPGDQSAIALSAVRQRRR